MLSMLLFLAVAPQAATPPPYPSPFNGQVLIAPSYRSTPGVMGVTPEHCRSRPTYANEPIVPGANLRWRNGSPRVALYRLLDRYVDGCPAPIIVNYRIGGSNAVGREFGRDPAPLPGFSPRP